MPIRTPFILTAEGITENITVDWFDAEYWRGLGKIIGHSVGRSTTYFFQAGNLSCVLRHYYRGGLIQKISREHYLYLGLEKTRAWRELKLLQALRKINLPVPRPIAANVIRKSCFYTNDIIIEKIEGAKDLYHLLQASSISAEVWLTVGMCIRQFHDHNVYHADLNIHNIMLDQNNKVWLIDFDRGAIKPNQKAWKAKNLARLKKSFLKEKSKLPGLHWSEQAWGLLLQGYEGATRQ